MAEGQGAETLDQRPVAMRQDGILPRCGGSFKIRLQWPQDRRLHLPEGLVEGLERVFGKGGMDRRQLPPPARKAAASTIIRQRSRHDCSMTKLGWRRMYSSTVWRNKTGPVRLGGRRRLKKSPASSTAEASNMASSSSRSGEARRCSRQPCKRSQNRSPWADPPHQGIPLVEEEPLDRVGRAEEVGPRAAIAGHERRRQRRLGVARPLFREFRTAGRCSSIVRPKSAAAEGQCRRKVTLA